MFQLFYLNEFLEADQSLCYGELLAIQTLLSGKVGTEMRKVLSAKERKLVNEINRLKRLQATTRVRDSIAAMTAGGDA